MRERQPGIFANIDWVLVTMWLVLVLLGWGNIYAAVYNEEASSIFDTSQQYGKQLLWIGGAILIATVILIISADFYTLFAWPIYIIALCMLILVLFIGTEVSGSKSWINLGPVSVQPAEFAKFATALALAKFLSPMDTRMAQAETRVYSLLIFLVPLILILAEKEAGVATVFLSFSLVLYREGFPGYILVAGLIAIILFFMGIIITPFKLVIATGIICVLVFFFFFRKRTITNALALLLLWGMSIGLAYKAVDVFEKFPPHQKSRILVWLRQPLGPEAAKKEEWNTKQALIAIGSGGFAGKGYLEGTQTKFDFVPEQETDFIFCTVGEEWGFLGATVVVGLFVAFILRIIYIAERQRSSFSRIYGYAVACVLFFHLLVNIGMTINLMPVIGIPLPFFSYGGSSLWGFTILLFIFIKLDGDRLLILR
jgi:rod shape determining protein RodA